MTQNTHAQMLQWAKHATSKHAMLVSVRTTLVRKDYFKLRTTEKKQKQRSSLPVLICPKAGHGFTQVPLPDTSSFPGRTTIKLKFRPLSPWRWHQRNLHNPTNYLLLTISFPYIYLPSLQPQKLKVLFLCLVTSLKIYCSFAKVLYKPKFQLTLELLILECSQV